jgi:SSS family solute:Na+ symporter/sodium/proline symporter
MLLKGLVIALYAVMIIVVGVIGLKRTRSFLDLLLAGGNVGPWMTAFSYGTAYFSAVIFIGFAGKIGWGFGFSGIWIGVANALIGVLGVWWLLGWRIKEMALRYNVQTMSEFLAKRYNSPFMKLFASLIIFIFLVPYSASVFMGLSYLFTASFPGIDYWHAVVFMATLTGLYLVMGGYRSMAMLDVIFGMIMTVGVTMLLLFTVNKGGGLSMIAAQLSQIHPKLTAAIGPPGWWPLFSLIFLTSVAPFAMPQLVQKFYAVKDKRTVRFGMIASACFALFVGGIAYFIGSTTRIFLSPETAPAAFTPGGSPIFDTLMPELLTRIIPESLSVIILLLILSASMSTLASLVLISSASLTKDFYQGLLHPTLSDRTLTVLMRCANAAFVIISAVLALLKPATIVTILGISWGVIGAAFLGPFIWGLFGHRATKFGAIAAGVSGVMVTLLLFFVGGFPSPQAGTIGMLVSLVIPVVGFFGRPGQRAAV